MTEQETESLRVDTVITLSKEDDTKLIKVSKRTAMTLEQYTDFLAEVQRALAAIECDTIGKKTNGNE